MVQALFDDENPQTRSLWRYPDGSEFNPDRNTEEFIAALPLYKAYGLIAFTINLQCGAPKREQMDFIAGGDWRSPHLWWWKQPANPSQKWQRFLVGAFAPKFHTQLWVDVDGDGKRELVTWNQGAKALLWLQLGADPTKLWEAFVIAKDVDGEGLAWADVDGDGMAP